MYWYDLTNTAYWSLDLKGGKYGGSQFMTGHPKAIIDTGTSLIHMPLSDFTSFATSLRASY